MMEFIFCQLWIINYELLIMSYDLDFEWWDAVVSVSDATIVPSHMINSMYIYLMRHDHDGGDHEVGDADAEYNKDAGDHRWQESDQHLWDWNRDPDARCVFSGIRRLLVSSSPRELSIQGVKTVRQCLWRLQALMSYFIGDLSWVQWIV